MRLLYVSFALLTAFAIRPTAARADSIGTPGNGNALTVGQPANLAPGSLFTAGPKDLSFNPDSYTLLDSTGLPYGMVTLSKTKEPQSLFLLGTGALGLIGFSRRRPIL
jgi:hypothetical protein